MTDEVGPGLSPLADRAEETPELVTEARAAEEQRRGHRDDADVVAHMRSRAPGVPPWTRSRQVGTIKPQVEGHRLTEQQRDQSRPSGERPGGRGRALAWFNESGIQGRHSGAGGNRGPSS